MVPSLTMLIAYNILLWIAAPFVALYYGMKMMATGKYRKGFLQRVGFLPRGVLADANGSPRLWIHAVSVGEVTAAAPIIASLREKLPDACIVLSTSTETGREMARGLIPQVNAFLYYPLDISFVVRRIIDGVQPEVFILMETELWPNFIHYCRRQGVRIVMANGRVSPRSFRRYALTRFFWKGILAAVDGVGVISETDADRFRYLGAPFENVHVFGNAKYDGLAAMTSSVIQEEMSLRLNMTPDEMVIVAGSTHEGEENIVLDVYHELLRTYPGCRLIIAPRHIERTPAVIALVKAQGFADIITMTEIGQGRKRSGERIIVVDVIGELFKIYSLAMVVFCGGSLVPRGGQNILEAAAWGKVILHGPYMDDFREERALLETAGASITIHNGRELSAEILELLTNPVALVERGDKGRRAVAANKGAASRYAEFIKGFLSSPQGGSAAE